MKRLTICVLVAVISFLVDGPIFCQGGAEELPLAEQKAFQAKQAAPQTDQHVPQTDSQVSPANQQVPPADQEAPRALQVEQKPVQEAEGNVPEGKALVYIYSVGFTGNVPGMGALLLARSGPIGILRHSTYYSHITEPGTTRLWLVAVETRELQFEAVAGQTYYVKAGVSMLPPAGAPELTLMPLEEGRTEMANCQPLKQ